MSKCYFESCKNQVDYEKTKSYFCSSECKDAYWGNNRRSDEKRRLTIAEIQEKLKAIAVKIHEDNIRGQLILPA